MNHEHFNPFLTPLSKDIHLIEASAGTGKTFSIAMLVLRFIIEKEIPIKDILVVTFTKAATRELKERVRLRLQEVFIFLNKIDDQLSDIQLQTWLEQLPDKKQALKSVRLALTEIDQSAIFTIHGFCQRVLREYALESGQLFDIEVTNLLDELKATISQDYWRQQIYPLPLFEVAAISCQINNPQKLLDSIKGATPSTEIIPKMMTPADILEQLKTDLIKIKSLKEQIVLPLAQLAESEPKSFRKGFAEQFKAMIYFFNEAQEGRWLNDFFNALPTLNESALLNALNGSKYRGEAKKRAFYQTHQIPLTEFNQLSDSIADLTLAFRYHFIEYLHTELEQRQLRQNIISQDDIILRLDKSLKADTNQKLRNALAEKYPIALIDEFQDTDSEQWFIFSTIFADKTHYLYLIGDPKQAIYKFRGADIYSYLNAKEHSSSHYTLATNYRSHPRLLTAINDLFNIDNPFYLKEIPYIPVDAGIKDDVLYINNQAAESFIFMDLEKNPNNEKTGYWTSGKAKTAIRPAVVNEINLLLKQAFLQDQPLAPKDIAILVYSNEEAENYQQLLLSQGIPAICLNKTSVFHSAQAIKIYGILMAIAHPTEIKKLKTMLNIDWFALNNAQWLELFEQESQVDTWLWRLQNYREQWRKKGVMSMMRAFFENEGLQLNIIKQLRAERVLTNVLHLLELLQAAETNEKLSINQSLTYFEKSSQQSSNESQEIRLESDENAIQVITIHSAKGLEYPIVFCPDLWSPSRRMSNDLIAFHENQQLKADIGSAQFEQHLQQAKKEAEAENSRLLYVALTRAKYRCYCIWANVRSVKIANESALNYILDTDDYPAKFKTLAAEKPESFQYLNMATETEIEIDYQAHKNKETLQARHYHRDFKSLWQMTSYSSLAHLSKPEQIEEIPLDKAQEPELVQDTVELSEELPKGAHTGNVVHELLENHDFSKLADMDYLTQNTDFIKDQQKICEHFGLQLETPELLNLLLQETVTTSLDNQDPLFYLANLTNQQCLKEMPFYFSAEHLSTEKINQALQGCPAFLPLESKQIKGQLTGFIDLICEYQGLYYVMDYKTNALESYEVKSLTQAMYHHNYGLQYWLYSLVLHQYLSLRIADYDYEIHFGGVKYLFVRGMQHKQAASGVFIERPTFSQLMAFKAALDNFS